MVTQEMDDLVEWARSRGVRRVRLSDGFEVELEPPAKVVGPVSDERPAPIAPALADLDGAGLCACGHSWLDHSEAGCLHGCSHDVCTSSATAEPEAAS